MLRAVVRGTLRPDEFNLNVVWESSGVLPRSFLLNAGYSVVQTLPHRVIIVGETHSRLGRFAIALDRNVPTNKIAFSISGIPKPPSVHIESNDIEVDYTSKWLPVPYGTEEVTWEVQLDVAEGMTSSMAFSAEGVTVLALRGAVIRELPNQPRAFGHCGRHALDLASFSVRRAMQMWRVFLPTLPETDAQIVVVNRPRSTFCYTRRGLIRIPHYIITSNRLGQIIHETGHLWWGNAAKFAEESRWLSEGLAEYGLLLAERYGILKGYQAITACNLRTLEKVREPSGLLDLSNSAGPVAAYLLRAKSSLCLDWLCRALGEEIFAKTLATTYEDAATAEVTNSAFLAIVRRSSRRAAQRLWADWLDSGR